MSSQPKTPNLVIDNIDSDGLLVSVAPVRSASSTWQEEMELNWKEMLVRDDLLSLRNFFKQGMDIAVMEEKVSAKAKKGRTKYHNHCASLMLHFFVHCYCNSV